MKVVIPRSELVTLVSKIQAAVPAKPSIPVLANVLVEAIDGQLIVRATDLSLSICTYANAHVQEEGAITLPARRLFQLVRELTAPQVEIHSTSPETAMLNAGTSHFKIQGMHKREFPELPNLAGGTQFTLPSTLLKELFSRGAFAVARDESHQEINGVSLSLQGASQTVTLMSTDGKRLAKVHAQVDLPPHVDHAWILPMKIVEEMVRMVDTKEAMDAKITITADKISLEIGSSMVIGKLLLGTFPDVSRIIPSVQERPIVLHREELMSLLRQVSLFTTENSSSVRFSFLGGELHLSVASGDIGEGSVNMPVNYTGEKLETAFHPGYFLDALRHSKDETVQLSVIGRYSPFLITDSSTAQFMIMPMRSD